MKPGYILTAEAVTEGHPDKCMDQISDAILDAMLEQDPESRVACECFGTTGLIVVGGEVTTKGYVNISRIARDVMLDVGYDRAKYGFDGETCGVVVALDEQSSDIAQGVDSALEVREEVGIREKYDEVGAGDIGIMTGYACDENEAAIPETLFLARKLVMRLAEVRKDRTLPYLRPDGKAQVSIRYEDDEPVEIVSIVVNAQHAPEIPLAQIREEVIENVIKPMIPSQYSLDETSIFVNSTGRFVLGGPLADTGLTGRKIVVDQYGPSVPVGGGNFNGKDPTKVDRSGAYMARYVAKHVVASGLAKKCLIEVSYSIGVARPLSVRVSTFGTGRVKEEIIERAILRLFDFRPLAIIEKLELRKPQYRRLARWGHMGRIDLDPMPAWEVVDMERELVEKVREYQDEYREEVCLSLDEK